MKNFVLSKLSFHEPKLSRAKELYKVILEKLSTFQSYYKIQNISKMEINGNDVVVISLVDPVEFTIHNVRVSTDIKTTVYFIEFMDKSFLMISSPAGIGLSRKGGVRRYIDVFLWQNLFREALKDFDLRYSPFALSRNHMEFSNWGEELREICITIPKLGKIRIIGKDILNHRRDLNLSEILQKGEISEIKVKSNFLKRIVYVKYNGIIKIRMTDEYKILTYLINVLRG